MKKRTSDFLKNFNFALTARIILTFDRYYILNIIESLLVLSYTIQLPSEKILPEKIISKKMRRDAKYDKDLYARMFIFPAYLKS